MQAKENQNSILIVDDDKQIQRALGIALKARNYNITIASTGEEALELIPIIEPDLIILDLTLPGISGFQVCKEIREWSKVPIIILSINQKDKDIITALDLGADDYIIKPFNTGELLARIRANLRRTMQIPSIPAVHEIYDLKIDLAKHIVTKNNNEIKLTKTEFSILKYFVENSGRIINYNLLLSRIWGYDNDSDLQILRVHISNLRKKIEDDVNRPRFILTEPGIGYRFCSY